MGERENLFFKQGAEAILAQNFLDGVNVISKKRSPKGYRNFELDLKIRKERTKSETKLLKQAAAVINTPKIVSINETDGEIVLEFINGRALKEVVEKNPSLCIEAGKNIRVLHDCGVIHGDLTTSNIIVANEKDSLLFDRIKKNGPLFFVDFGLGFFSKKLEDKAVDLVVFKKTFNATHSGLKNGWELVMQGYSPNKELVERMKAIEKRARYH